MDASGKTPISETPFWPDSVTQVRYTSAETERRRRPPGDISKHMRQLEDILRSMDNEIHALKKRNQVLQKQNLGLRQTLALRDEENQKLCRRLSLLQENCKFMQLQLSVCPPTGSSNGSSWEQLLTYISIALNFWFRPGECRPQGGKGSDQRK